MEIQEIRKRIDEADEQLVQAFAKRMRAASDIADYKREHGLPVWDPARARGDGEADEGGGRGHGDVRQAPLQHHL